MSKASGYSLWLVPDVESDVYHALARCIAEIARRKQTSVFVPHVTLVGGISGDQNVWEKTQTLAALLSPYKLRLGDIGSHGMYFRMLFSKIELTQTLLRVNAFAQYFFSVYGERYFPHLSLAYGNFSPGEVAELKDYLTNPNRIPFRIVGMEFLVRAVQLWHTEGEVDKWCKVASFPVVR